MSKIVLLAIVFSRVWIVNSFVNPCSSDPCDCNDEEEDPYCSICHTNGCDLCNSGYFKADYNYPCVQCQETFGDECMHCQDFDGCGQCINGYTRTYDVTSDLWYCALDSEDDSVTVQIDDATFDDDYDTSITYIPDINIEEEDDPFDSSNTNAAPSAMDLLMASKAYDVDYETSEQYETTYTQTFLNTLISEDWFNTALESTASDMNDTNGTETETECDCNDFCNNTNSDGTLDDTEGNRRNLMVFPPDNRKEIYYPWWFSSRWSGLLRVQTSATTHGGCSASLIGPNYIITAAHCVHGGGLFRTWYTNRVFYPSRTRFYVGPSYSVTSCRIWWPWRLFRSENWDIAVCRLGTSNTGRGWFRFKNAVGSGLSKNDYVRVKGYPGDKTFGTQWWTYGTVWDETAYQIRSRNYDTVGGMSGSPIYKNYLFGFNPTIYGVHTGWSTHWYKKWIFGRWYSFRYNRGTKINTYLYYSICQFMGKNYKNC